MNLLSEVPPEVLTQFSAESLEKSVRIQSNTHYEELLKKATERTMDGDEIGGVQA